MNLLLDTQALLWFLLDDPRLSAKARECIVDATGVARNPEMIRGNTTGVIPVFSGGVGIMPLGSL